MCAKLKIEGDDEGVDDMLMQHVESVTGLPPRVRKTEFSHTSASACGCAGSVRA
jgi:hypothetical protein